MKKKLNVKQNFSSTESIRSNDVNEKIAEDSTPPEEEKEKTVTIFQLFRYSTCLDIFLILLGVICAAVSGVCVPLNMMFFGNATGAIVHYANVYTNETYRNSSEFSKEDIEVYESIKVFCIETCIISAISFSCIYISVLAFGYSSIRQIEKIRSSYMRSVLNQDISWYDTRNTGDFAARITEDLAKIEEGLGDKMSTMSFYLSIFLSGLILALIKGWLLALICLVYLPLSLMGMAIVSWLTSKFVRNEIEAYASAGAIAEEVLASIRTVVTFGGQRKEIDRYKTHLITARDNNIKGALLMGINNAIMWLLVFPSYALSFYYGVKLIIDERHIPDSERIYTPGNMITVFYNILISTWYFGQSAPYFQIVTTACVAASKIFSVIDNEPVINLSKGHGKRLKGLKGNISFKNIYFHYPSRKDVQVLNGVDLKINAGETVALVGSSGCGKSTCLQLMQRYYDPVQGEICIDDTNIRDFDLRWLRSQIGVVGQEPALFSTTIAENIKLGNPKATAGDVEKAAMKANAHTFIMRLPQGYDTIIGEKGAQLSGGQKQRIAIARALIRNPKILLLDEATSALDTYSEYQVQRTIDQASKECTTIIVAHRLSTVRGANKILVFSHGRIVEEGSHQDLIERQGAYYNLITSQTSNDDSMEIFKGSFNDKQEENEDSELIEFDNTSENYDEEQTKFSPIWEILKLSKSEWFYILAGCIAACVTGASIPLYGIVFGDIVGILSHPNDEYVRAEGNRFSLYFVFIGIGTGAAAFFQWYVLGIAAERITMRIRTLLFRKVLSQEAGWFDRRENGVGAVCARLSSDVHGIQGAAGQPIGAILNAVSTVSLAVGFSLYYDWKLALVGASVLLLIFVAIYLEKSVLQNETGSSKDALSISTKIAVEAISNIRTVSCLGCENIFCKKYKVALEPHYKRSEKHAHMTGTIFAFSKSLMFYTYAISLYYGGILLLRGEIDVASIFKISELLLAGAWSIGNAVAFTTNFQKGIIAAENVVRLIKRPPRIRDDEKASEYGWGNGNIRFNKINFHYPLRPNITVLSDFNLSIPKGKTIAFVGPSGCGKSTIIQLVQRFYDPASGIITSDRTNIADIRLQSLKAHFGSVSQEPNLFDRTIAENIAYGDNSRFVDKNEIVEAAKKANIHNFITSLPLGYDTRLGDKGAQVSGGQKQRLAIARALIRNPEVLILDEATSALDCESEKVVQEALDKASEGRTCIMIAHRLTTVQRADVICVLNKGQIEEMGTHTDLLTYKGMYHKLYSMQIHGVH